MEPFRLPRYSRLTLSSLIGVFLVVMSVMMVARREMLNPFSSFTDLFGENAVQAALTRGFRCWDSELRDQPHSISDNCAQRDIDPVFDSIHLQMSGSKTREISFWLRNNTLTIGDLELLWGKAEVQRHCEIVVALWPNRHIIAFAAPSRSGRITYFVPVLSISFMQDGLPKWWQLALINDAFQNCVR